MVMLAVSHTPLELTVNVPRHIRSFSAMKCKMFACHEGRCKIVVVLSLFIR